MDKLLVWLKPEELVLLDGKVSLPETQGKIDEVRNKTEFGKDRAFILKVVGEGNTKGIIGFIRNTYVSCEICGKRSEIATYKSGRRKGQIKGKESTLIRGVSFAEDLITFQGHPRLGICNDCHDRISDALMTELRNNAFDYHYYQGDCPYRKDDERKCYKCGQTMFESEMGRSPALTGQGSYPSTCPHCGEKSLIFGKIHESTHKWQIIKWG